MKKKLILCIFALAMLLAVSVSAATPYDFGDKVAYYGFDNSSVLDGGNGGYNGSLTGDGISYVDGLNGGYAVKMDSDSYVSIPVDVTCLNDEAMSIVFWFNTDHLNGAWNRIISTGVWGQAAAPGVLIGLYNATDTGLQYVAVGIGADDASQNHWNLITAPEGEAPYKFDDEKWHCLGYSVSEGNGFLYLDGKLIYTFTYDAENATVVTYEETACIGGYLYYDTLNEPFAGTVDEVYFIPRLVTEDEMKAYYDAEANGTIKHEKSEAPVIDTTAEVTTEDVTTEAATTASGVTEKDDDGTTAGDVTTEATETASAETDSEKKDTSFPIWIPIVAVAVIAAAVAAIVIVKKKK